MTAALLSVVSTLLNITMSTERPSKRTRADSPARSLEGRFSDPSTPLPMTVDSNCDNDMITVDTELGGY